MKIKSVLFVAAVCVLAALTSCGGSKKGGLPDFSDDEFAVATIGTSSAALQTTYPATIKGIQDVEVRPKVSGFITKVFVHEGQTVSAGQALFSIDSETYQAAVRSAAAAVNTAKAQANTAKLTYQNNKKLYDNKIIGEFELSTAANSYATAKAQVAQAEAALASAREQLAWCTVTSPSAGVVGSLPFKVGAMMGEAVVFSGMKAPKYFFTNVKRHGALLAKGRMLGIQFDTLFTDELYFKISRHAIAMATRIRSIFEKHGITIAYDSPTNQQFVVLSPTLYEALSQKVAFEIWERKSEHEIICRFVTSWATKEEELDELDRILQAYA
jgi:biotin carboxyl carrier protein